MPNYLELLHKTRLDRMLPGMVAGGVAGAAGGGYLGSRDQGVWYNSLGIPTLSPTHGAGGAVAGGAIGALLGAFPGALRHSAIAAAKTEMIPKAREIGRGLSKLRSQVNKEEEALYHLGGKRLKGIRSWIHPFKARRAEKAFQGTAEHIRQLHGEANVLRDSLSHKEPVQMVEALKARFSKGAPEIPA